MEKNKVSVEMIVISQPDPNGTERNELESILVNVWFIVCICELKRFIYLSTVLIERISPFIHCIYGRASYVHSHPKFHMLTPN